MEQGRRLLDPPRTENALQIHPPLTKLQVHRLELYVSTHMHVSSDHTDTTTACLPHGCRAAPAAVISKYSPLNWS